MSLENASSFESKKSAIRAQIARAKLTATTREQLWKTNRAGDLLAIERREGRLSAQEYDDKLEAIVKVPNIILFDSLSEFSYALRLLVTEADARQVLSHENAHMNRVEFHNLKARYGIGFAKDDNGMIIVPIVRVEFPLEMSDEQKNAIDHDITSAPDELSDGDIAVLQSLQDRKSI